MGKTTDKIHELVDLAIESENEKSEKRSYMGASGLGVECARQLWYSFHTPKKEFNALTLRKFAVGHALEPVVVEWLKKAGFTLYTVDSKGEQFGFEDGVIGGHCDGVIKGIPFNEEEPYLLEVKTANNFYWKEFNKSGIDGNERYKGQVHIYMNKFKLKKCLFVVVNKDTQELYFEIVEYDEFEALRLLSRGHSLAVETEPPARHYESKSYFKCKYCSYYKECWK